MRYIVQAETTASAREHVTKVGGSIKQEFDFIHSLSAELTDAQVEQLRSVKSLKLFEDRALTKPGPTSTE